MTLPTTAARQQTLAILARMPADLMRAAYRELTSAPPARAVRGPEVGLVMVRGRAGGGGAAFNLGEASVVRATVALETGEIGHATILGRDAEKARMAAHLDALWQRADWRERVERDFVEPTARHHSEAAGRSAEETEATRVDFFTLVRGEDS